MKIAVYPGSFDPITNGHIDIIRRIAKIFDQVIVVVSHSPSKKYLFTAEERSELIRQSLAGLGSVTVDVHEGLTVEYVKKAGANVIIRGLRAVVDFEYEMVMANMNRHLNPDIETMIVFASPEHYYIASTTVKEVARFGGDVQQLVPPVVASALKGKFLKGANGSS